MDDSSVKFDWVYGAGSGIDKTDVARCEKSCSHPSFMLHVGHHMATGINRWIAAYSIGYVDN